MLPLQVPAACGVFFTVLLQENICDILYENNLANGHMNQQVRNCLVYKPGPAT